jgi:hypothetical protein
MGGIWIMFVRWKEATPEKQLEAEKTVEDMQEDEERDEEGVEEKLEPEEGFGERFDRLEERIFENGVINEEDFAQINHQLEDLMACHELVLQAIQDLFDLLHRLDKAPENTGFRFKTFKESGTVPYCIHLAPELDSKKKTEQPKEKVIAEGCERAEGRNEDIRGQLESEITKQEGIKECDKMMGLRIMTLHAHEEADIAHEHAGGRRTRRRRNRRDRVSVSLEDGDGHPVYCENQPQDSVVRF